MHLGFIGVYISGYITLGINTKLAMAQSIISLGSNAKVTKKSKKKQDRREKIGKVKRERWLRLLKEKR